MASRAKTGSGSKPKPAGKDSPAKKTSTITVKKSMVTIASQEQLLQETVHPLSEEYVEMIIRERSAIENPAGFARSLGLSENDLYDLNHSYGVNAANGYNQEGFLRKSIGLWRQRFGLDATAEKMIQILSDSDFNYLADQLSRLLPGSKLKYILNDSDDEEESPRTGATTVASMESDELKTTESEDDDDEGDEDEDEESKMLRKTFKALQSLVGDGEGQEADSGDDESGKHPGQALLETILQLGRESTDLMKFQSSVDIMKVMEYFVPPSLEAKYSLYSAVYATYCKEERYEDCVIFLKEMIKRHDDVFSNLFDDDDTTVIAPFQGDDNVEMKDSWLIKCFAESVGGNKEKCFGLAFKDLKQAHASLLLVYALQASRNRLEANETIKIFLCVLKKHSLDMFIRLCGLLSRERLYRECWLLLQRSLDQRHRGGGKRMFVELNGEFIMQIYKDIGGDLLKVWVPLFLMALECKDDKLWYKVVFHPEELNYLDAVLMPMLQNESACNLIKVKTFGVMKQGLKKSQYLHLPWNLSRQSYEILMHLLPQVKTVSNIYLKSWSNDTYDSVGAANIMKIVTESRACFTKVGKMVADFYEEHQAHWKEYMKWIFPSYFPGTTELQLNLHGFRLIDTIVPLKMFDDCFPKTNGLASLNLALFSQFKNSEDEIKQKADLPGQRQEITQLLQSIKDKVPKLVLNGYWDLDESKIDTQITGFGRHENLGANGYKKCEQKSWLFK